MPRLLLRLAVRASFLVALPALAQEGDEHPSDAAVPAAALPAPSGSAPAATGVTDAGAAAAPARQATIQLVPAFLMSYGGGASDNFGAGLMLRLDIHPTDRFPMRTGGFVSGEVLADGAVRVAGGLAGAIWLVGCRVGLAYRTEAAGFASSLGLEIGKSIDFMGFSIGGRMTIPLVDFVNPNGATRTQGIEGQLVVTVGWPVGLDGPTRRSCGCPHGRHAPSEAPAPIEEGATDDAPAIDAADGP